MSSEMEAQYYKLSLKKDATQIAFGAGMMGLSMVLANRSDDSNLSEINLLNSKDLFRIDRGAVNNYSSNAQLASDVILYSSISLPFVTYFSKKCRSDGGAIAIMALETALINNGITNILKASFNRYRPFNYNPNVALENKLRNSSRQSFVSGHTSNATSLAFLTARVLTDLHPYMERKYLVWTVAATIPAAIGYLRIEAGKHFPTDVIGGYIIGAAVGYFVPSMHLVEESNLTIQTIGLTSTRLILKF